VNENEAVSFRGQGDEAALLIASKGSFVMLGGKSILAGAAAIIFTVGAQAMAANGIDQRRGGSHETTLINGTSGQADAATSGRLASRARHVPEPSYLGLAGMAASVLLMRRRRGRSLFGH
jgi:hypothetical protein